MASVPVMDNEFLCPISMEVMEEPVMIEDGTVYDRKSIVEWFRRGKRTSPLTNLPLRSITPLVDAIDLRRRIKAWRLDHDPGFTGCRRLECMFYGEAPDYLCSGHGGRAEPSREFTDEDEIIRILGCSDSVMEDEHVRIYEMFMKRLTVIANDTDFSFLDIRTGLRVSSATRLYEAVGNRSTKLQIYLVQRTICPWLLDPDLFSVGLCYAGQFGDAPRRLSELHRFTHRPPF